MKVKTNYYSYVTYGLPKVSAMLLQRQRKKIYQKFILNFSPLASDTILDVGVGIDVHDISNYLERYYPYPQQITALCESHAENLAKQYPKVGKFIEGDGCDLPFSDHSFDIVYTNAVIEHVGSRERQRKYLSELIRVARKGVFLTTPNRNHFLEFHTGLPLFHYLPPIWYRKIYRWFGKTFYAEESNLNLLRYSELASLARDITSHSQLVSIESVKFLGFSANILLTINVGEKGVRSNRNCSLLHMQ